MGKALGVHNPSLEQRRRLNAAHSAWDALAQSVLAENVRTLQDLVQEMLRPMLRSWLDDNLPTLVERLVAPRSNSWPVPNRTSLRSATFYSSKVA